MDVKEAKILFTENNEIIIPEYQRAFSYQIIEAFMVLANETVAEYMQSIEAPFVYRIHEKPAEEKATAFRAFAQTLGLNARFTAEDVKPYDYQNLLRSAENLPIYSVLNRVMLRSMQLLYLRRTVSGSLSSVTSSMPRICHSLSMRSGCVASVMAQHGTVGSVTAKR